MMKRWGLPFGAGSQSNQPPQPDTPAIITPADAKQFGFENFGNTCYANSVLQALYFCGPFRELVVQYPDPSAPDVPLPPPLIPITSNPPTSRPKSSRKPSTSDSPSVSSQRPNPAAQPSSAVPGSIPIPTTPPTLMSALRSLYVHISKNPADKGTVSPKVFMDKLKQLNELFRSTQHQDAHEFLNFLLNTIVEEMESDRRNGTVSSGTPAASTPADDLSQSVATLSSTTVPTTNDSSPLGSQAHHHRPPLLGPSASATLAGTLVHRLFEGVLTSETRCLTCETVSARDESFLDLSIDIEQNSSVTACLRQFSASEMLCQRNKFFCDSCCDLQEAEKRMKIKRLPNILALHLKRFKYQEDTGRYIKLTYRVAFPFHLRLFNTVDDAEDPDRLYELFAIVVHIGAGPHHGHYVSVIKTRDAWLLFDDDAVEVIKEADIPKYFGDSGTNAGSAYVLYYQAVDLDVATLGVKTAHTAAAVPATMSVSNGVVQAKIGIAPQDGLTTQVEEPEQDHDTPQLPPGLHNPAAVSVSPPSPTSSSPFDTPAPTFSTPPYSGTGTGTPASAQSMASVNALTPLVIPSEAGIHHDHSAITPSASVAPTSIPVPATPVNGPLSSSSSSSALGNFMNSLRHTPSTLRGKGGKKEDTSHSHPPVPPVPPLPSISSPIPLSASASGSGTTNSLPSSSLSLEAKPRPSITTTSTTLTTSTSTTVLTRPHSPTATMDTTVESLESSAASHGINTNGHSRDYHHDKEKENNRKSGSSWFPRRKSVRDDKKQPSGSKSQTSSSPGVMPTLSTSSSTTGSSSVLPAPPSPSNPEDDPSVLSPPMVPSSSSSSGQASVGSGGSVHGGMWFNRRLGRRPSESAESTTPQTPALSSHPHTLSTVLEHQKVNSKTPSTAPTTPTTTSIFSPSLSSPPPLLRSSSSGANDFDAPVNGNHHYHTVSEGRSKTNVSSSSIPSSPRRSTNGTSPSPRGESADARSEGEDTFDDVAPTSVPSRNRQSMIHSPPPANGTCATNGGAHSSDATTNVANGTAGVVENGTATVKKRASRKLSFTTPILSFGRNKDR